MIMAIGLIMACDPMADIYNEMDENPKAESADLDFILEDEVVAKGVPCQFVDHAMVLMPIVAIVRQDDVRVRRCLDRLEVLFDLIAHIRKEAVAKVLHDDLGRAGAAEEFICAGRGLVGARAGC